MLGSVLIDTHDGWSCSNEAAVVTERDTIRGDNGKIIASKHTSVIRAMSPFSVKGRLIPGNEVDVVFMLDDTETKLAYKASVKALTDGMVIFMLGEEIKDIKTILKKIGGYNNGK